MYDILKTTIITFCSALVAYLDPVSGSLQSLMTLFFLNFIIGYATGVVKNNESFQLRKFFMCFLWAAVILALICFFYIIGERNGNKEETLYFIRSVTLVAIWAFGTNILRNLRYLSHGTGVYYNFFNAIYTWFSLEIIKKLPFLSSLNQKNNENQQRND